ncbi:Cullin-4B [Spathaspora sp. JA1]|nr:Cullin-4B [Spathaspora sp. JA1]
MSNTGNTTRESSSTPSHQRPSSSSLDIESTHKRKKPNSVIPIPESSLVQLDQVKQSSYGIIDIVLSNQEETHSYSLYYRQIENLCRFKHVEQSQLTAILYEKLSNYFNNVVRQDIDSILQEDTPTQECIGKFLSLYKMYDEKLRILARIFLYLDKNYLLQHSTKKTIIEYGLGLFVEYVLDNENGENKLANLLLEKHNQLLKLQRVTPTSDTTAETFTKLLVKLHSTRTPSPFEFNLTLIQKIIDHYNELKQTWSENYIPQTFKYMNQEIVFFKNCGKDRHFLNVLLTKLKWNLLFFDFNNIIRHELPTLIHKPQELKLLYQFCQLTESDYSYDSIAILNYELGCFISDQFEKLIDTKSKTIIIELVELYQFYNTNLNKLSNSTFEFELRNSLTKAVNIKTNNIYIISQLCKYIDTYFKKSDMNSTPADFLQYVMIIFKAITNKHEFLLFYKKDLCKRLLLSKSDITQEQQLTNEFLQEIGESDEDSISFKVMYHDLQISTTDYSQVVTPDFEFIPLILEKKYWPSQMSGEEDNSTTLPINLQLILDTFSIKYRDLGDKFNSKKLYWNNFKLHQLVIVGHFNGGDVEIQCNLLQAVVILLFNSKEDYSLIELIQETLMDERLLRQVLDTLISKKLVVETTTNFKLNSNFTSKTNKVKLSMLKEKPSEITLNTTLEQNRQEEYKAAIVKIMKQQQTLHYTNLLKDTIELVSKRNPTVSIHDLKTCIDELITNEYLKRQGQDITYIP